MRTFRIAGAGILAAVVGVMSLLPISRAPAELALNEPAGVEAGDLSRELMEAGTDMEVLGRGPLHEAFAGTYSTDATPGILVNRAPPEPVEELPPEQKPAGENVEWVPGYWMWDEDQDDFIWISGIWRELPPGQRWVPGYWAEVDGGSQWISGFWTEAEREELEYLPAPPESLEQGANIEAPSDDHFWVPGCWVYRNDSYLWRAGYWSLARQDWLWVPAHYVWTPRGCVYVSGYWDYRLPHRGVLFAPIHYRRPLYRDPGYCYTPRVSVNVGPLLIHLFVRPRHHHYYYGDYYGRHHFHPWHDYCGRHPGFYDPLYSYYRWHYQRRGHSLSVVLNSWHGYYREHRHMRPPRTYDGRDAFIHRHKEVNKAYVNNSLLVERFDQRVQRRQDERFKFVGLDARGREDLRDRARRMRELEASRVQLEVRRDFASRGAKQDAEARGRQRGLRDLPGPPSGTRRDLQMERKQLEDTVARLKLPTARPETRGEQTRQEQRGQEQRGEGQTRGEQTREEQRGGEPTREKRTLEDRAEFFRQDRERATLSRGRTEWSEALKALQSKREGQRELPSAPQAPEAPEARQERTAPAAGRERKAPAARYEELREMLRRAEPRDRVPSTGDSVDTDRPRILKSAPSGGSSWEREAPRSGRPEPPDASRLPPSNRIPGRSEPGNPARADASQVSPPGRSSLEWLKSRSVSPRSENSRAPERATAGGSPVVTPRASTPRTSTSRDVLESMRSLRSSASGRPFSSENDSSTGRGSLSGRSLNGIRPPQASSGDASRVRRNDARSSGSYSRPSVDASRPSVGGSRSSIGASRSSIGASRSSRNDSRFSRGASRAGAARAKLPSSRSQRGSRSKDKD